MVALDEDMVGSDNACIIVQSLKVCLALFIRLNNGTLLGAHFTPATPLSAMNIMMAHLHAQAGGGMNWMGMVSKFSCWSNAVSGFHNPVLLASYFRARMQYLGAMNYADLDWAAPSYDIRFTDGIAPLLEYRATPNPNPCTATPVANVLRITGIAAFVLSASNAHPGVIHNVPNNTAGFAQLSEDIKTIP